MSKKIQNVFYHSTDPERWEAIKKEGVLWGIHGSCVGIRDWKKLNESEYKGVYRYTYLSPRPLLTGYGGAILKVRYTPKKEDASICVGGTINNIGHTDKIKHNYTFDPPPGEICTQFSVFEPIPLSRVRRCFWYSVLHYLIVVFTGKFKLVWGK